MFSGYSDRIILIFTASLFCRNIKKHGIRFSGAFGIACNSSLAGATAAAEHDGGSR